MSHYFNHKNRAKLSLHTVYIIGLKILELLEIIHEAGYVHNDISLRKVVLGYEKQLQFDYLGSANKTIKPQPFHFMDLSFATPYIDFKTGRHLKKGKVNCPINISNEIQTLRRLNYERTSRKDDLAMLCTLLITLCNHYCLPDFKTLHQSNKMSNEQYLTLLKCYKESYSLSLMCKYTNNKDHALSNLCQQVEALSFTSKPDYQQLKHILKSLITHEQQKVFLYFCLKSYDIQNNFDRVCGDDNSSD